MRKFFSSKILTSFFCIVCVVSIFVFSASPAFALGTQMDSAIRYSNMPFDYISISGGTNPWMTEWMFSSCGVTDRASIDMQVNNFSQDVGVAWNDAMGGGSSTYNVIHGFTQNLNGTSTHGLMEFEFRGSSGGAYQLLSLTGTDMVIEFVPNAISEGPSLTIDPAIDSEFYKVQVKGSFAFQEYDEEGKVVVRRIFFDENFYAEGNNVDLLQYLYDIVDQDKHFTSVMWFPDLSITTYFHEPLGSDDNMMRIYYNEHTGREFNRTPLTVKDYLQRYTFGEPPVYDVPFEMGAFLEGTVGSFFNIPIFGQFTFGTLLGVSFGLLFLLWFIKLIK